MNIISASDFPLSGDLPASIVASATAGVQNSASEPIPEAVMGFNKDTER